jgi:hypothetical protein
MTMITLFKAFTSCHLSSCRFLSPIHVQVQVISPPLQSQSTPVFLVLSFSFIAALSTQRSHNATKRFFFLPLTRRSLALTQRTQTQRRHSSYFQLDVFGSRSREPRPAQHPMHRPGELPPSAGLRRRSLRTRLHERSHSLLAVCTFSPKSLSIQPAHRDPPSHWSLGRLQATPRRYFWRYHVHQELLQIRPHGVAPLCRQSLLRRPLHAC